MNYPPAKDRDPQTARARPHTCEDQLTSNQPRTWFIDFDGTLVAHSSHMRDEDHILEGTKDFFMSFVKENDYVVITTARGEDHKGRVEGFLAKNDIRFDLVLCGLPTGPRILVNDSKPCGTQTAYSYNLERDKGILSVDWD